MDVHPELAFPTPEQRAKWLAVVERYQTGDTSEFVAWETLEPELLARVDAALDARKHTG